jgi:integrase/recombinase XerD
MRTYLEPGEVIRLEAAAGNLRDRLLIRLLARLGCRVSEALGLKVKDVDFNQAAITIQHLKTSLKIGCPSCGTRLGKAHVFCPRCGVRVGEAVSQLKEHRRVRTLPIDEDTLQMLKEYIQRGGPVSSEGKQLIFGINRHRAWQVIKNCAERARLPKLTNPETGKVHYVSPHRLRDAFAVHAVKKDDSGDGLRMLQVHLGHTSFNTTARYRKVSGVEHRKWYEGLWGEMSDG